VAWPLAGMGWRVRRVALAGLVAPVAAAVAVVEASRDLALSLRGRRSVAEQLETGVCRRWCALRAHPSDPRDRRRWHPCEAHPLVEVRGSMPVAVQHVIRGVGVGVVESYYAPLPCVPAGRALTKPKMSIAPLPCVPAGRALTEGDFDIPQLPPRRTSTGTTETTTYGFGATLFSPPTKRHLPKRPRR